MINSWLITEGGLDVHRGTVIGLCAESHCQFMAEIAFPDTVEAALRVGHLGRSSVRYELALYREGHETAIAVGGSCTSSSTGTPAGRWRSPLRCAVRCSG